MYIENLKIGCFGKLKNAEFDLTQGVNIIEGNNESGKTTLGEFIKYIFYGLSGKASDGELSERKRHLSWGSDTASGSLVISSGEEKYRIERETYPFGNSYKDSVSVVDLSTFTPIKLSVSPGEYFFGLPENVFTHTSYIRQCDGSSFKGESLGQAVENLLYSADESINTDKAIKKLDYTRKFLRHKINDGGGSLDKMEIEISELEERLENARKSQGEIFEKEEALKNAKEAYKKNRDAYERYGKILKAFDAREEIKRLNKIKEYDTKIREYRESYSKLESDVKYGEFTPDEDYIKQLEKAKTELQYARKARQESLLNTKEITDETQIPYKEIYGQVKEGGGKDSLLDRNYLFEKSAKQYSVLGIISGVFALILCIITLFFGEFFEQYAIYTWCCVGLLLACAVGGIVMSFLSFDKQKKLRLSYNCLSEKEFFSLLDEYEDYQKNEIFRIENLNTEKRKNVTFEEREQKQVLVCVSLLEKWNVECRKIYDEAMSKIDETIEAVRDICKTRRDISFEIEKYIEAKKAISYAGSAFTEEELIEYSKVDITPEIEQTGQVEIRRKYDFNYLTSESLNEKVNRLEKDLALLKSQNDDPCILEIRLNSLKKEYGECSLMYESYVLAIKALSNASINLRNKLAPMLSKNAGILMGELTNGKYSEIGVSEMLKMTFSHDCEGVMRTHEIENVSSGTQDAAYISLRLSLLKLLCREKGECPVLFDEAFSRLDDNRLCNMLKIMLNHSKNNSQVILFTSGKREAAFMKEIGEFNYIFI